MQLPAIHLAVMQPSGFVHSLGFLDQARYFRYQFRRLGATVTLGKNRLREDAVNFVFGAHLGFPAAWQQRHACIFVNLEQLDGSLHAQTYVDLLARSAVVDYDPLNLSVYTRDPASIPLVPFLHAPYLDDAAAMRIASRPIDLLFFGSVSGRRKSFIDRIEACGVQVTHFDRPLYGPERDAFVQQAKAVLNCHYYETSRFEQARAFPALSLGTPVISERTACTTPAPAYEDAVFWVDDASIEGFFTDEFRSPAFAQRAEQKLAAFRLHDPIDAYAELLSFAQGFVQGFASTRTPGPWRPIAMNLGSGRDYLPNWLNVDVLERAEPDVLLDLSEPLALPARLASRSGGHVLLEADSLVRVHAGNVLEHVRDLAALMTNLLALLAEGGELSVEVPYEHSPTAWRDPSHVRAMNESSWIYYTEWFWHLGWFSHRFEMTASQWLDLQTNPCDRADAAFMRVTLRKVSTSPNERSVARTMQADFGQLPDDTLYADEPVARAAA